MSEPPEKVDPKVTVIGVTLDGPAWAFLGPHAWPDQATAVHRGIRSRNAINTYLGAV